jgi:imidazole glycerol phosphate synthase glutamine amidotransferase subunit
MTKASPEITVVVTGVANLASVLAGWKRLGLATRVTEDPEDVERADFVELPGVGAFGAAMDRLRATGLDQALVRRVQSDRPTLAICVGLQVLCDASEESPGVAGLGLVPGTVQRFPDHVRIPQFGWNQVQNPAGGPIVDGYAYFANSYRLPLAPAGFAAATSDHGGAFVAAIWRGNMLACQFHPELSGAWGLGLLDRWVRGRTGKGGSP